MYRSIPISITLIVLLAVSACGDPPSTNASGTVDAAQAPKTRQKTVFDDQLKALDKAKAVEKQLQKDKEKQDKAIEDAGG